MTYAKPLDSSFGDLSGIVDAVSPDLDDNLANRVITINKVKRAQGQLEGPC